MKFLFNLLLTISIVIYPFSAAVDSENYTYSKGDTLEIVIPRVFNEEDIGKAYPKFITGLKGDRMVESQIIALEDTIVRRVFEQVKDGLILNAWGTGLGMYDRGLSANTNIRRARLCLMKVLNSKKLVSSDYNYLKNSGKPMLLTAIDYGYSFNLSISGPKEQFTLEIFNTIKDKLDNQESIEGILKENQLQPTFSFRGISPKTAKAQIPTNWEDLEAKYRLGQPMPVFGKYVLLDKITAEKIEWIKQ